MSYLYELDCHCHFSASADPGANGGVDALMSLDPANVSTTMEASSALTSPCREIETLTSSAVVIVKEQVAAIPGDPPRYSVSIVNSSVRLQVGDKISIPTAGAAVSVLEVFSTTSSFFDLIIELKSGVELVVSSVYPAELTTFRCRDILPYINRDRHVDMALEVTSDIVIHDVFLRAILEVSTSIDAGMTVDYSVNQDLNAVGEIKSDFLDKFNGDFPEYFNLGNYSNSQKLYASGDVTVSEFVGDDGGTSNLYSYIEEGVFLGKYTTHNEYSELIADDINTYITPYTNHTEGEYQAKFYLDELSLKPLDSRLLLRLSAPVNNVESELAPRYTISDIKFEDPSGTLIVQYEDLVFLGDASDSRHPGMYKNFTTYSLKPNNNVVASKYEWQDGYPDLQKKNGYTLSFNVLVEARDDAFDGGFTEGFIDIDVDGNLLPVKPTNNLRISTIEIWSSGFPGIGPSPEN